MTNDVAIIGVGLHPFGRFDKTAMEMGAEAIQFALDDAGVDWKDIQFGFGGSYEVSNPDAVTRLVGLTGITFTNVFNACATAASAIQQTADTIRLGKYDIGIAIGLDKHPRGAFTDDPAKLALPQWYAENGQFVTTKFFGMKANHYLNKHGISQETLAKVAAKNFRNGEQNPNAFRRKPISEEEILNSTVLNYPLTQYMFCAPDEGAAAVIMCRGDIAHRFTKKPVYVKATEIRTRTFGAYEVHATFAPLDEDASPTVYAAKAAYETAGIGPDDVDVAQLQDTDAGAEVIHMAETGLCADGEQEKLLADGATEIHGTMPVNTDGGLIANGEPIGASGLRQVHELVRQLRGEAGDRQVPGEPKVGLAQVYGAPGTASATILSRVTAASNRPMRATVADTVNRYVELLGTGSADELAALYTPDATVEDPVGSGVRHGHDEIRELYSRIEKQDRTVELLSMHINGNEAAFLARLTVITGDSRTRIDGIDVMTFDDQAAITSMRAFWSAPDGR